MPRYQTVLFDLDGTLIDSVRLILDSYHHTLACHGLPARTDEYWLKGLGTPLRAQFREWSEDPARIEAMVLTYRDYNLTHHDRSVAAYPGVVEMIAAVRGAGVRTALVTSKNREGALRGLRVVGLEGTMEVVIGADDVTNHKPHPEPVQRAAEVLGIAPKDALFVGDSTHDMSSGRAAGARTGAVLWGPFTRDDLAPTGPEHWLESPADLVDLLLT
ncbi:MAG: dehII [Gemmatimonadetes bacterium]|nr:dehII [Gemmatimonadota bacterium]